MKDDQRPPVKTDISEMLCNVSDDAATSTGNCRSSMIASTDQVSNFL
jgi:hypothetical protein